MEDAVSYISQVCEAVAEAHAAGIVHRDIKPANLFLTRGPDGSPCVKLVDFGVAKFADGGLALTGTMQTLGSPLYMPPESMNGAKDVDGRVDIWSLGVTLYELLAQSTPFQAETLVALVTRVCAKEPTPIESFRPDVPPGLAAVIMQCLEKDRDRRWPTVAAFAAALAPYALHAAGFVCRARGTGAARRRGAVAADQSLAGCAEEGILSPASLPGAAVAAALPGVASAVPAGAPWGPPRLAAMLVLVLVAGTSVAMFAALRPRASGASGTATTTAAPVVPETSTPTHAPVVPVPLQTTLATAAPVGSSAPTATAQAKPIPGARATATATTGKSADGFWDGARR